MDTIQHPPRSAGHESGITDIRSIRPRTVNEYELRSGTETPIFDENGPSASLPRGFEGMLKTTTETGDIGMFSIKPSRIHPSHSTPRRPSARHGNEPGQQRPSQSFQPYGVPSVDDRKRLPSYARDAASEVISMYETASQKSGSRVFDEPDCRSYSMTQTSYSSYTLSNHRSYASLRSQPETNGQLQRARSPFAYPVRLKRTGFRPSSPALTDGGIIDYSRRAEIERGSQGPGYSTSSPSSLYAQRRKPNQPFRPEANVSTPSLLSQASPPRRTSSPLVSGHNGISSQDWHRRTGPASRNTSPARSTFSIASTINLCAAAQAPSTATTPGKVPPSPLYYDYTEDFEGEVCIDPLVLDSPPAFRIDKTIPEDRPMSSDRSPSDARNLQWSTHDSSHTLSPRVVSPIVGATALDAGSPSEREQAPIMQLLASEIQTAIPASDTTQDRKSFRLSGLGYGAQLLNSHVAEAFKLLPASDFKIRDPDNANEEGSAVVVVALADYERANNVGKSVGQQSIRDSKNSARISSFPPPPRAQAQAQTSENSPDLNAGPENGRSGETGISSTVQATPSAGGKDSNQYEDTKEITLTPTSLVTAPTMSLTNLNKVIPQETITESPICPPTSMFNCRQAEDCQVMPKVQPLNRSQYYHEGRCLDFPATPDVDGGEVPNFSHQLLRKDMARSESPMLAPKPISPARQLKLKNSIPQLMKALPPLPPEPTFPTVSPVFELPLSEGELPYKSAPVPRFEGSATRKEKREVPDKDVPSAKMITAAGDRNLTVPMNEADSRHSTLKEKSTDLGQADATSPSKLKLKLKSPSQRPMSPPDSRPWNLAENYPWSAQTLSVRLPTLPLDLEPTVTKPAPRFKLRVTRASQSTQGTVRINRESADVMSQAGQALRNPKDLFTPAMGIASIFRQVSKDLHSRRTSATSNHTKQTHTTSISGPLIDLTSDVDSPTINSSVVHLPLTPADHLRTPEAHSVFSDDSSCVKGHHNLRKRLSHLRTRITNPYSAKTGAQSYDDITWKERNGRNGGVIATPSAARSIPNLHSNRNSTESKPLRRFGEGIQRQKLKAKVQGWLRGAKLKISAHIRSRTTAVEVEDTNSSKA